MFKNFHFFIPRELHCPVSFVFFKTINHENLKGSVKIKQGVGSTWPGTPGEAPGNPVQPEPEGYSGGPPQHCPGCCRLEAARGP